MGIYTSGNIYGIMIYTYNTDDENTNILFHTQYNEIMTKTQMKEAYLFYKELDNQENKKIHFKFYTECSSTIDKDKQDFMAWQPMSLNLFMRIFGV